MPATTQGNAGIAQWKLQRCHRQFDPVPFAELRYALRLRDAAFGAKRQEAICAAPIEKGVAPGEHDDVEIAPAHELLERRRIEIADTGIPCGLERGVRVAAVDRCEETAERRAAEAEFGDFDAAASELPALHARQVLRRRKPCMPPSTARTVPVVAEASGLARYAIAAATSCAVTRRPIG